MTARILVVEDNPDNMKLVSWILEDEGYAFKSATSAEEGLALLKSEGFDLVLMDIALPNMDGQEATRRLRADPELADLPVIAITAHAIKEKEKEILGSGVSALVTKPIDEDVLKEQIRTFLC